MEWWIQGARIEGVGNKELLNSIKFRSHKIYQIIKVSIINKCTLKNLLTKCVLYCVLTMCRAVFCQLDTVEGNLGKRTQLRNIPYRNGL